MTVYYEPHLTHPQDPQDAPDPLPARYGYISPNQFPVLDERDVPEFVGKVDVKLDIEEAREAAQQFADMFGHSVEVEVSDEDDHRLETETIPTTLSQEMNGYPGEPEEDLSNEIAF
jgi:hypothetical protein